MAQSEAWSFLALTHGCGSASYLQWIESLMPNYFGRARSFNDPEALQAQVNAYFADMADKDECPLMLELAIYLGINRDTLLLYASGEYDDVEAGVVYSGTFKRARDIVEMQKNKRLISGKGSTVGYIFDLKNNHNWKDKTESETYNTITTIVKSDMNQDQALEAYTKQIG